MPRKLLPAYDAAVTVNGTYGDNLTWTLDAEGTLTISGEGAMHDYSTETNPENAPWIYHLEDIQTIIVEEGVTSIGHAAFSRMLTVTSVSLPESLTAIGGSVEGVVISETGVSIASTPIVVDVTAA